MSTINIERYLSNETGNDSQSKEIISIGGGGLLDFFYPVGTYYETSNGDFDPNTEWGGTWIRDTIGLATVGAYKEGDFAYSGGSNDFEKIVQAKVGEKVGEKEHTLTVAELASHTHQVRCIGLTAQDGNAVSVPSIAEPTYQAPTSATGSNQPHNNVQPSIGVYRWHRMS